MHTVFALFDEDGDGLLSYQEFIAIMKDRLHRGFKVMNLSGLLHFLFFYCVSSSVIFFFFQSHAKNEGYDAFKECIKQELKSNS